VEPRADVEPIRGGINAGVWSVRAGAAQLVAKVAHRSGLHPVREEPMYGQAGRGAQESLSSSAGT